MLMSKALLTYPLRYTSYKQKCSLLGSMILSIYTSWLNQSQTWSPQIPYKYEGIFIQATV